MDAVQMEKIIKGLGDKPTLKNFIEQFGVFAQGPGGFDYIRFFIKKIAIIGKLINTKADTWNKIKLEDVVEILDSQRKPISKKERVVRIDGKNEDELIPYYGATQQAGWIDDYLFDETLILLGEDGVPFFDKTKAKSYIISGKSWVNNHAHVLRPVRVEAAFLKMILDTYDYDGLAYGATRLKLNQSKMKEIIFKQPPLEEQKRIVAKVDELMTLCDQLEAQQQQQANTLLKANAAAIHALLSTKFNQSTKHKQGKPKQKNKKPLDFKMCGNDKDGFNKAWERIAKNFHTLYGNTLPMPPGEGRQKKYFVGLENLKQLRQMILQLAVRGKLVPQYANEERALSLLNKLRIKYSVSNKGKRATVNNEVIEHPFDLPDGWAWARFPELGIWGRGKSKHRPRNDPSLFTDGKWPLIQTGDVANANGLITAYSKAYSDIGLAQSKLWPTGTMCITIAANIADTAFLGIDACFPDSVVGLIPDEVFEGGEYIEYFVRTAKNNLTDYAPSTAQKNINLGILEQVNIPLPPIEEQKRIVAKVDHLMTHCDQLEQLLTAAYSDSEKLIDATIRRLVA